MRHQAFYLLVALTFVANVGALPFRSSAESASTTATSAATALTPQSAGPLPGGCGHVTSPGEDTPVCCVSGFVYMDGQPLAGAEVQIQNRDGDQVTLVTQVYSDSLTPSYRLNLSAPPLEVAEGALITVTARYSGYAHSLNYTVRAGSQQVDVVLARPQRDGYVFDRQFWGQAEPRQFNRPTGLAVDREGNVYVVDSDNARVQVFGSDKQFRWQWGTRGNLPGQFLSPTGIAVDRSSNVYVADTGNHRIQKFSRTGRLITTWGRYGSADDQFIEPIAVAADPNDNIYVADPWNNRIKKFSSSGRFRKSWDYQGGDVDVVVDNHGDLYVLGAASIRKFNATGDVLASWEGSFEADEPGGITVTADGIIYVTDYSRVLVYSPTLDLRETWNLTGVAGFYAHGDIVSGNHGYLYAADVAGDRILVLDPREADVGRKVVDSWGDSGRASGQLRAPQGIDVDRDGNIYVTDTGNNRLQKFGRNGDVSVWRGPVGTSIRFDAPYAITIDRNGNLYIVDRNPSDQRDRLWKLDRNGSRHSLWPAGGVVFGQPWKSGDAQVGVDSGGNLYLTQGSQVLKRDSAGSPVASWGNFGQAMGIAVDSNDRVYVSDSARHQIQRFASDGTPLGPPWASQGSDNGQLNSPTRLRLDSAGNVYVVDAGNHRIQKFSASGTWKAAWGSPGIGAGQLGEHLGEVSVDNSGSVYIADSANNRVQVFRPMGFTKPIATITWLSRTSLGPTDRLEAYGIGQDSDETSAISTYKWTFGGKMISSEPRLNIAASELSPGVHQLSFSVTDGEGERSEAVSVSISVAAPSDPQWTMLLYLAGDYQDRGQLLNAFNQVLNKLRSSPINPLVRIAVQIDGPSIGDTRRLLITPDSVNPPWLAIGEQAMDSPTTLTTFVRWGQESLPANKYYLAIANHGQAVQGIAWDSTSDASGGAYLTVAELGEALRAPDLEPIDVLHLDACAMNLLEVAYEVRDRVDMLIASQYLAWDFFAYSDYQRLIGSSTTPDRLTAGIVEHYAALAGADGYGYPYTIAALNIDRVATVQAAVDALAVNLAAQIDNDNQGLFAATLNEVWLASQKFESNGDYIIDDRDMYLDLVDWAERVRSRVNDTATREQAKALIDELTEPQRFVIASIAESNPLPPQYAGGAEIRLNGSHGVSIFYPRQYNTVAFDRYMRNQLFSFTGASRWPDFLIAGRGPIPPPSPRQPLPGPLQPLTDQRQVFLPVAAR